MDCERASELFTAKLDGEIHDADPTLLEAHLAGCSACREAAESLRRQDADLRKAFAPRREAAGALAGRVIAKLGQSPSNGAAFDGRRRLPWLHMLLAAAAGFLLAVFIFRGGPERVDPPALPVGQVATPPVESAPVAKQAATLAFARGVIEVERPGQSSWETLPRGASVEHGARVRTDSEGRCELRTPDGSEVRLNGSTEVLFHTNRRLELAQGRVWSSVAHDQEPYRIQVPQAEATVTALGTVFDVQSSASEAVLYVVQGTTRVEGKERQELVQVGERAKITRGLVTQKTAGHDLVLATSWVKEILVLKGPDNPELNTLLYSLFAQIGEGKMNYLSEKEIVALGDHCIIPLARFIQSDLSKKSPEKRVQAARILQKIAQPWSTPYLIDLLDDREGEVRYWAAKALERLTDNVTQGIRADDWRKLPPDARDAAQAKWSSWWQENKDNYPAPP